MGLIRRILGPKSKYDMSLPYTYLAKAPILEGDNELVNHYFADTICGLIEYLDDNRIESEEVELFGVYLGREIKLDNTICLDHNGNWLSRPYICEALENQYNDTIEECYKGHVKDSNCSFEDRDRSGSGPY